MKKIIVIGAGIMGASTAYHLSKKGVEVIMIDRKDKGQATDAAAGIVCPWLTQRRNKDWYRLAKSGARYYPELIKELEAAGETQTGYAQVGALHLHKDIEKLEKVGERALKRKEDAPELGSIKLTEPKETTSLFPPLDPEFAAVYVSGAARVDGRALREALLRAAQKNGATLIVGNASLLSEGKNVTGALVDGQRLIADSVIVCAGAWANTLLHPLGIDFNVTYQKAQIVHLELENANTGRWPVVMPPGNQYLLAFENGRIVGGATHEDTEQFDTRVTPGGLQEVFNKLMDTAPGLADSTFVEARVGFRPFTPGFLPVFGAIPDWDGLFVANGLGASGLTMAPYIGAQLVKFILGEKLEIDLEAYSINKAIGT